MAEEKSTSWASSIPEVFYDLLARVLPGLVLLLGCINSYGRFRASFLNSPVHWIESQKEAFDLWVIVAGAVFCWICGLLLTPFGDTMWRGEAKAEAFVATTRRYGSLLRQAEEQSIVVQPYGPDLWQLSADTDVENCKEISSDMYQQLHEHLKDRKPEWRGVLTKVQAEVTFYANVWVAVTLVAVSTVVATLLAFLVLRMDFRELARLKGLGYWTPSLAPLVITAFAARKGLHAKSERMWRRHMAYLVIDLRQPLAPPNATEASAPTQG